MTVGTKLADHLRTAWEEDEVLSTFRVIATERALDVIEEPTFLLRLQGVSRLQAAPLTKRRYEFTANIISPRLDLDEAIEELEEWIELLLPDLGKRLSIGPITIVSHFGFLAAELTLYTVAGDPALEPLEA